MYLGGDIGGTKTHLVLCVEAEGGLVCTKSQKYPSQEYKDLSTIVKEFLKDVDGKVSRACFGIAGPVKGGVVHATNLPWNIHSNTLSKETGIPNVELINDLEANAYGLCVLEEDDYLVLNTGDKNAKGNQALISAGTGLGEAGLYFDGKEHLPFASEGGHVDFAPRTEMEVELWRYLKKEFGHVSYERVLSGPGLYNIYRFIIDTQKESETGAILSEVKEGKGRVISDKALKGESKACTLALEMFVAIYGAAASNMVLKMMAFGGLFVGGGIAPKIIEFMQRGTFMEAFLDKGRFKELLKTVPVRLVLSPSAAVMGASYKAQKMRYGA